MALSDKQGGEQKAMLAGAVLTILGVGAGIAYSPISLMLDILMGERLAFALTFYPSVLMLILIVVTVTLE